MTLLTAIQEAWVGIRPAVAAGRPRELARSSSRKARRRPRTHATTRYGL